ncbi:hypothetical protein LPJGGPFB_04861 [Ensifer adhaerens]|nr:hypothetical protein [Ensifer adhaerens]
MGLPSAFDGFGEHSKRVSPTAFDWNRYSVPATKGSCLNRRNGGSFVWDF